MIIEDDQACQTNDSSLPIVTSMQRFAHHELRQAYEARDGRNVALQLQRKAI